MIDANKKYDVCRNWVIRQRKHQVDWNVIRNLRQKTNRDAIRKLEEKIIEEFWPEDLTFEKWEEIVNGEVVREDKSFKINSTSATINDSTEKNAAEIPESDCSSWVQYKDRIRSKGFKPESIDAIERATENILTQLSLDTRKIGPIKGMVVGNVQSGKTANMEALMAMAADNGWNMFIILSGTIDNLRKQTQNRMSGDLKCNNKMTTIQWRCIEHPSPQSTGENDINNADFSDHSKDRYFTVCLKNASRLRKLLQWLYRDPHKTKNMRILVIDDEADQASVNTADVNTNERKTINQLISNLVSGKDDKNRQSETEFQAMNYIGYTATPYANVLNERPGRESLYPSNFITTLGNPKEYFGPQQIFGATESRSEYEGLDIVRTIRLEELDIIRDIHSEETCVIPESLKDAICWFLCDVAVMRYWKMKKPASMLIHTSFKTLHHEQIAKALTKWISKEGDGLLERCAEVWEDETKRFSRAVFYEEYSDYGEEDIRDYPAFSEIRESIEYLINQGLQHISLGDAYDFNYTDGVHLCVDNCLNNGVDEDGMFMRLAYPEDDKTLSRTPAFIVIGGNTLSRGLTLEGLVSTYFLRNVRQADTLMQMGRWFGYRKGYELLQRIWLTEKAVEQFEFLSNLDQDLRDEIKDMECKGRNPRQYGPKIRNTPEYKLLRITAENKMQSAKTTDFNYSGAFMQTYMFSADPAIQKSNLDAALAFIEELGYPVRKKDGSYIWNEISFEIIKQFINKYSFSQRTKTFARVDGLVKWVDKVTKDGDFSDWNVILAGISKERKSLEFPFGKFNFVNRTRKKTEGEEINIGVLSAPRDRIADIDPKTIEKNEELKELVKKFCSSNIAKIRHLAGVENIPQLILYIVDKDSKAPEKSATREDLNAVHDLAGFCLTIPGQPKGVNYCVALQMNLLDTDIYDNKGDLE